MLGTNPYDSGEAGVVSPPCLYVVMLSGFHGNPLLPFQCGFSGQACGITSRGLHLS